MDTRRIWRFALSLAFAATATAAHAQASNAVPRTGKMGYLNGGFGEEQADLMRDMSSQFPVRFTFSRHNGTRDTDEFVADVHLRIVDSGGRTVLDLPQQGPILLLRLPEGTYSIEAERNGEVKTRKFDVVAGRHQAIALSWAG